MSLVAYAASSDEDSDCDGTEETNTVPVVKPSQGSPSTEDLQNGHKPSKSLNLPKPKQTIHDKIDARTDGDDEADGLQLNLPAPKKSQIIVEEADDEFLRKRVAPSLVEKPTKAKPSNVRQPVRITIPSLAEIGDDDITPNGRSFSLGPKPQKSSGLLNVLPPPKFDAFFGKQNKKPESTSTSSSSDASSSTKPPVTKTVTSLVPDSVSNRIKQTAAKPKPVAEKKPTFGLNYNNSDGSDNDDDDGGDFFSLNTDDKLPEVSASEISAMVAKKANKMAEFSRNLQNKEETSPMEVDSSIPSTSSRVSSTDDINIEALIGARAAKRSRKGDIQFIDISQDQVTSSHDEWKRNQLQSETQYQPTGRLTTGDPGAGTKKKHQITYLAHQAKANEAELQAMWATNRQSRRQTQSKYGF